MIAAVKKLHPDNHAKSSLMVGLGETEEEMIAAMKDLRAVGCDFLTVGQYLQPTQKHLPVGEFVTPDRFDRYRDVGLELGFHYVASGALVRSSYKAGEFFIRDFLQRKETAFARRELQVAE